jgi:hypothetical protein
MPQYDNESGEEKNGINGLNKPVVNPHKVIETYDCRNEHYLHATPPEKRIFVNSSVISGRFLPASLAS